MQNPGEHQTELSEHRTNLSVARSHLSNERTHLSVVRTAIALISFGISINRFSLFLLQSNSKAERAGIDFLHDMKDFGIGMVTLGSFLLIWSIYRFIKVGREIDTMTFMPAKWSIVFFSILILLGAVTTGWMILK